MTTCLPESGQCPLPNTQFEPLTSGLGQTTDTDPLVGLAVVIACLLAMWVWRHWVHPALIVRRTERQADAWKRRLTQERIAEEWHSNVPLYMRLSRMFARTELAQRKPFCLVYSLPWV